MTRTTLFPKFAFVLGLSLTVAVPLDCAYANKIRSLHRFTGADGADPYGGVILDSAGNIYGTTTRGGAHNLGTVYKIAPDGTQTVLYSFAGGADDGAVPLGRLTLDETGNLYGAASLGIDNPNCYAVDGNDQCGMIFRIAPDGTETVVHKFNGQDGARPGGSMIWDKAGNLIGTTFQGAVANCGLYRCGVIFRLAPDGTYTVLHEFNNDGHDGGYPYPVIADKAGNLYGTTSNFGAGGGGIVFKLALNGTETILHSFTQMTQGYPTDGYWPSSSVVMDKAGNLYGATQYGGVGTQYGAVYKIAPDGSESVLHSFRTYKGGLHPFGNLVITQQGNLYGTTLEGGHYVSNFCHSGCGVIFEITPDNSFTSIHRFKGGDDGVRPGSLTAGKAGNLLGTAGGGGDSFMGTVFTLKR